MKTVQDKYFKKAKQEGYFARSVYKLQAIDEKYKLLRPGMAVLDLGCSPGSWLQYVLEVIGEDGSAAGIDIQEVRQSVVDRALVLIKDIALVTPEDFAPIGRKFDVVLSDMAPKTTGIRFADQTASAALCEMALGFAAKVLAPKGSLVMKIFSGPGEQKIVALAKRQFSSVTIFKPPASRSESFETFIICRGFNQAGLKGGK